MPIVVVCISMLGIFMSAAFGFSLLAEFDMLLARFLCPGLSFVQFRFVCPIAPGRCDHVVAFCP
jgi:hypothetical protein